MSFRNYIFKRSFVDTLKKDKAAMQRLYEKGYHDAGRIQQFIH